MGDKVDDEVLHVGCYLTLKGRVKKGMGVTEYGVRHFFQVLQIVQGLSMNANIEGCEPLVRTR